jgi:16S rRNA (adenine1518-N6/adenine1519-N6)-dimethyltransferase
MPGTTKPHRDSDTHGLRLKKSLGQNLLEDPNINRKIVAAAEVREGERVLEIGPGMGHLTQALLGAGADVLAVEIDQRLLPILDENFGDRPDFEVIHFDILKLPEKRIEDFAKGEKIKVVANLPYYNASQILFRLAQWKKHINVAVLTLQKEFVDRLVAGPNTKDYGALTLKLKAVANIESLFSVKAHVFFPEPKVDSRTVHIDFRQSRLPENLDAGSFNRCVTAAFSARRKTIANSLSRQYDRNDVGPALAMCGIDPRLRAENLELDDYFKLTKALAKVDSKK